MKGFKKFIIALSTLLLFPLFVAEARSIGNFSKFRITTSYARTGYLLKSKKQNYVINLEPSRNRGNMTVKNRMVNSNGDARSDAHISTCGYRYELPNWASAGYVYALDMARQNWWDGASDITGSWSPDTN